MARHSLGDGATTGIPHPVVRVLGSLRDLPGLVDTVVLDARTGRVFGGTDAGAAPLLAWVRQLHDDGPERARAAVGVTVTSSTCHDVVNLIEAPDAERLWVGVRIDRSRGDLEVVRRRLGGAGATTAPAPLAIPAPRRAPEAGPPHGHQHWRSDEDTLRRVLAALRRLT